MNKKQSKIIRLQAAAFDRQYRKARKRNVLWNPKCVPQHKSTWERNVKWFEAIQRLRNRPSKVARVIRYTNRGYRFWDVSSTFNTITMKTEVIIQGTK